MKHNIPNLIKRLWGHIDIKRRHQFLTLFAIMILASFAEVLSIGAVIPFLTIMTSPESVFESSYAKPIIDFFEFTESSELLLVFTVTFSLAALLSGAMRLLLLWYQTRLSHGVGADIGISIYRKTLFQPYILHVSRNSSEVIAGITGKANVVVDTTLIPIFTICSAFLILISILSALIIIDPQIAIFSFFGFGSLYVIVIIITQTGLSRDSLRISYERNMVMKALQEGLGGIRDVLINGTQLIYVNLYKKAELPLRRALANINIVSMSPRYAIESLGMILIAILAYTFANRSEGIESAIPILGAFALGAQRLLPVLQQAYSSWSLIKGSQASLNDAIDLLDQPLPEYAHQNEISPIEFKNNISLINLGFSYKKDNFIIEEIDLEIAKGSRVGFIGSTGSGKSTLLDIFMGLLLPTKGKFLVDGVLIDELNHRNWQSRIAHVPQTIFLADSSISENIAFGIPKDTINHDRVKVCAEMAQLSETIESWDMQYDSSVGERGVRISGGQRQRIAIARALYKEADVIVFDEATSALDNLTEKAVMNAIENLNPNITIIIVAHRLSTLRNCNEIIELKDGKIFRKGNYKDIIE